MSGAYALRNDITLDGSPNESMTAGRNQTAAAYVPPLDIVAEIRITTAPMDATAQTLGREAEGKGESVDLAPGHLQKGKG